MYCSYDSLCLLVLRLSDHAKQLLNKLGGGLIQNLKFRDTWYFVGQKGIEGFTEFEQVTAKFACHGLKGIVIL